MNWVSYQGVTGGKTCIQETSNSYVGLDCVLGVTTRYELDGPGFEPR